MRRHTAKGQRQQRRYNPVAKALSNPVTRPRTVRDRTRYTRTAKHKEQPDDDA